MRARMRVQNKGKSLCKSHTLMHSTQSDKLYHNIIIIHTINIINVQYVHLLSSLSASQYTVIFKYSPQIFNCYVLFLNFIWPNECHITEQNSLWVLTAWKCFIIRNGPALCSAAGVPALPVLYFPLPVAQQWLHIYCSCEPITGWGQQFHWFDWYGTTELWWHWYGGRGTDECKKN